VSFTFDETASLILMMGSAYGDPCRQVARNIYGTDKRGGLSRRPPNLRRLDAGKQKSTVSEAEEMMNEERFGFLSSTDDGNAMLADIPSEAVSLSCRNGLVTLSVDDGRRDEVQDGRMNRTGIDSADVEVVRAGALVEEDMISLDLEPGLSDDELLLRPTSP
jgi:hypothetical protein